jgi:hypothetical protein
MGPFVVYLILTKWLWNSHVGKPKKNTMGIGVHKIIEQMEKNDLNNWANCNLRKGWLWHRIEGVKDIHL